ncbi:MAG: HAMP domain-containing protein [Betaproteobacteria bacterium]|nr:MAG: HAMP domain-containing protein [Betaproteobacteria bacterium]
MKLRGLVGRSLALLLTGFLLIQAVAVWLAWAQVLRPMTERAADDMAGRLVLATQTWVELPPETRPDYEAELLARHALIIRPAQGSLATLGPHGYYAEALEQALSIRLGHAVRVRQGTDPAWSWVDLQMGPHALRVGFMHERLTPDALWLVVGFFVISAIILLGLAIGLVGRLAARLRALARSAWVLGQGGQPVHLPETGAQELVDLTRAFNRMAGEVAALLENRTVLLAGISHDLRTPLTRLRLALSLLPAGDAERVRQMEAEVAQMNRLIGDMLALARDLQPEAATACDLTALLRETIAACAEPGRVTVDAADAVIVEVAAAPLRRILANLIDNALHHGGEGAVTVILSRVPAGALIRVCDRGVGIPVAELDAVFRPFYRLDTARTAGGSGLGLAIVRQLADAYGLTVTLDAADGGGLCAQITCPSRDQRHGHDVKTHAR